MTNLTNKSKIIKYHGLKVKTPSKTFVLAFCFQENFAFAKMIKDIYRTYLFKDLDVFN